MPKMDEFINSLGDARLFLTLDANSGQCKLKLMKIDLKRRSPCITDYSASFVYRL